MARRYIDFISAYCDRWCARCPFTERCSNFAVSAAIAMCDGNHDVAIELAIGPARIPDREPPKKLEDRVAGARLAPRRGRDPRSGGDRACRHPRTNAPGVESRVPARR